jgi:hypothetical protein
MRKEASVGEQRPKFITFMHVLYVKPLSTRRRAVAKLEGAKTGLLPDKGTGRPAPSPQTHHTMPINTQS